MRPAEVCSPTAYSKLNWGTEVTRERHWQGHGATVVCMRPVGTTDEGHMLSQKEGPVWSTAPHTAKYAFLHLSAIN